MKCLLVSLLCLSASVASAQVSASDTKLARKLPAKKAKAPAAAEPTGSASDTAPQAGGVASAPAGNATTTPAPSAKTSGSRIQLNAANSIRMNYGYPAWNTNPTRIDAGSLIMREGSSGKLVQIHLVETEPDSSIFSGLYSITFQNIEKFNVDFYVPPQGLLETHEGMKKIASMINSNQLKRHPFILRRTPTGSQTVEIFDTREQAQMALRAYQAEQQVQGLQNQKFPSDQQVATAKLAAELKEKEAQAKAAAERIRLEQLEAQKLAAMLAKQAELNAAEKARRKKEAADLAAEALALFRENKFQEATAKFEKVVELDPDNHGHYFQYGVALYKIESFDRSLVYLNMADGADVNPIEKNFFIGLNHFRIREFQPAIDSFEKVVAAQSPDLSPPALFYKGVVLYEEKRWDEAKTVFQTVLDTGKDPQLDQRAETYIEQILRIQQFELEKSRKWQLSATIGEMYDSNILLLSDSSLSQGTSTNTAGYRTLAMGSVRYRPIYAETTEFSVQADMMTMYTLTKSFGADQSLRNSDPSVLTLTAPYTYKGLMFGKGYKFDVTPGAESIVMSVEDNQNKLMIQSGILNFANLFVMNEKLYSNFNIETRYDKNMLTSSAFTGDNDSTAVKVKLINSNLHFLFEDKAKIITSEASVTLNQASGKNASYNRYDLAIGYIQPWLWETSATAKLSYYYLNYPLKTDNRTDGDYTLTLGASKKLSEIYSSGFVGTYNMNQSSNDSNTYNKFTAMLTLSALYAF